MPREGKTVLLKL